MSASDFSVTDHNVDCYLFIMVITLILAEGFFLDLKCFRAVSILDPKSASGGKAFHFELRELCISDL